MMLGAGPLRRFIPISLDQACAQGVPKVTRVPYLAAAEMQVPAISFGTTTLDGLSIAQYPVDTASASRFSTGALDCFVIEDAVVHGRAGYVTCGDHLFTDFLHHIPLHLLPGVGPLVDGSYKFPDTVPVVRLADAVHFSASNLENYFHWTVDAILRFDPQLVEPQPGRAPTVGLIPQPLNGWQAQFLDLLPKVGAPVMRLDHGAAVAVARLVTVPSLAGGGFHFHPETLRLPMLWRRRLDPDSAPAPGPRFRRIYISRQDTTERRLLNEGDVMALVRRRGFEVVQLSGMDVAAQIRLFSASSKIIAPHGAGLTNLLYCRPDTTLLELHMDSYVNWCFRRIAGLQGMRYGCVIGTTDGAWQESVHGNTWTIDLDKVAAAISEM